MVTEDSVPPLWLGVDLSTQSLTLVVLDDDPAADHVYLDSVVYDTELPQYQTEHGMHVSDGDNGEKVRCGAVWGGAMRDVAMPDRVLGELSSDDRVIEVHIYASSTSFWMMDRGTTAHTYSYAYII